MPALRSSDLQEFAAGWLGGTLMAMFMGHPYIAAALGLTVGIPMIVAGRIMMRREKP